VEDKSFDIKNIIWGSPIEKAGRKVVEGLDLIPSDVRLLTIDLDLQLKTPSSNDLATVAEHYVKQRTILKRSLATLEDEYDYVLIDCPPNLYLVTQNALAASDFYVVTALPDHLSTVGLSILEERVEKLNKDLRNASGIASHEVKTPTLGGIIFVRVRLGGSRITNVHDRKMREIQREYPEKVFDNYTTEGIGYSEAAERALPVFLLSSPNTQRVADQYRDIAAEFIRRIPAS